MTMWIIPAGFAALAHLLVNAALSREVFLWEPSPWRQAMLLVLLWCIPVAGAFLTYHSVACDWFGREKSSRAGHIASGAFLEMDAVFDPGKRHVIEARQEQGVEILQDEPK